MSEWGPATEVEAAMRDALSASDQELYFRLLSRCELLLPVSAEALAGRAPMGWGTWTTGNRTHVLAFTSPDALYSCLNEPGGSYRLLPYHRLAADWPNYEWWLAVNPGLPIEAYLPSWFVAQLTRGEVRLPGRTMGARARIAQGDLAAALNGRVRAVGPVPPASAPIRTQVAAAGAAPGVETLEAEIVDYPPVTATARVYSAAPVTPADVPASFDPYAPGGTTYGGRAGVVDSGYPPATGRFGSNYASPADSPGNYAAPPPYAEPVPPPYAEPVPPPYAEPVPPPYAEPVPPRYAEPVPPVYAQPVPPPYGEPVPPAYAQPVPPPYVEPRVYPQPAGYAEPPGYAAPGSASLGGYEPPTAPPVPPVTATTSATGYAANPGYPPSAGYTVYDADEHVFVDPEATSRIGPTTRASLREPEDAVIVPSDTWATDFVPANDTENNLLVAARENNTDAFLSTLLLARVIVPVPFGTPNSARPRDPNFPWQIESADGQRFIAVFTSPQRLEEHLLTSTAPSVSLRFVQLIGAWPDEEIAFAINPGSPVGAILPGSQIIALASWAADVGLRDEPSADVVVAAKKAEPAPAMGVAGAPANGADRATVMQRTVPHAQVPFYLERGYDRVSGFVNRASELSHLRSPKALYKVLGLVYPGSPFADDDAEVHVVRWVAHRADLYRLPYGGQHEAAMRAMQGWVIERPPFRGNGFAPGEADVVSEFKVDSVRLPHGAQIWRLAKDGSETLVASFDADSTRWVSGPLPGGPRA